MSSLISGFEYDIFVSYRQKDNKGEHWVTKFVSALKTELEATFKEDISIYFDEPIVIQKASPGSMSFVRLTE